MIELAQLYPGPLAGRLLASWGFEVIKVEPPGGDPMRTYIPSLYGLLNAGKTVVFLDLKTEEGRRGLEELVGGARAVLTSFRREAARRLGASYEKLKEVNPRLIYVAITSFADSDLPGHDINFAAAAGLLGDKPMIPQCVDVASGLMAAFMIAAAVAAGRSGYFEVPMESVAYLLNLLNFMQLKDRGETYLTGGYPFYNVYSCIGGRVALGAVEEKFWLRFCELIGREDLKEHALSPEAVAEVGRTTEGLRCSDLLERARQLDVPLSPVLDLRDAAARLASKLRPLLDTPS